MKQYQDLLRIVRDNGWDEDVERTGIGRRRWPAAPKLVFDLRDGFPLLTPKRVPFRWVAEELKLGDDDVVSVMESACVDPGCPLVETHLTVFGADGSTRRWKLTRQRYAVAKFIVQQALRQSPA